MLVLKKIADACYGTEAYLTQQEGAPEKDETDLSVTMSRTAPNVDTDHIY